MRRRQANSCSSGAKLKVFYAMNVAVDYLPRDGLAAFEAAACGTPVLTDWWPGLDQFFEPGTEILVARDTADAVAAVDLDAERLRHIGLRARERALAHHSAQARGAELVHIMRMHSGERATSRV